MARGKQTPAPVILLHGALRRLAGRHMRARRSAPALLLRRGRGRAGELAGYQEGTAARPRVCGSRRRAPNPTPVPGWWLSRCARARTAPCGPVACPVRPGPRPAAAPRRSLTPRSVGCPPDHQILAERAGADVLLSCEPRRPARTRGSEHARTHAATADDAIRCAAMLCLAADVCSTLDDPRTGLILLLLSQPKPSTRACD